MSKLVSDCLRIMRIKLGRRNENDPDSTDDLLRTYLTDFIQYTMTDDVKLFEQFGTLKFTIDGTTDGVYTFNDVGADSNFSNISVEAFITLTDPPSGSISWNRLHILQDPGQFYDYWGVNNEDILIRGYPTELLYYGDQLVFRTIPDTEYDVYIYGYKISPDLGTEGNPEIPFDYWYRYISYGAALNYARDYRYDAESKGDIERDFAKERSLVLTRTFNQAKKSRCQPSF